jgi:hypothetical protein
MSRLTEDEKAQKMREWYVDTIGVRIFMEDIGVHPSDWNDELAAAYDLHMDNQFRSGRIPGRKERIKP